MTIEPHIATRIRALIETQREWKEHVAENLSSLLAKLEGSDSTTADEAAALKEVMRLVKEPK